MNTMILKNRTRHTLRRTKQFVCSRTFVVGAVKVIGLVCMTGLAIGWAVYMSL